MREREREREREDSNTAQTLGVFRLFHPIPGRKTSPHNREREREREREKK